VELSEIYKILNIIDNQEKKIIENYYNTHKSEDLEKYDELLTIHRQTYNYYITEDLEAVYEYWAEPSPECNCDICQTLISSKKQLIKEIKQKLYEKRRIEFNNKIKKFLQRINYEKLTILDYTDRLESRLLNELRKILRGPFDLANVQKNRKFIKYWGEECDKFIALYSVVRNALLTKKLIGLNNGDETQANKDYDYLIRYAERNPFLAIEKIIKTYHPKYSQQKAEDIERKTKNIKQIKEKEIRKLINQSINIHTYHDFFVLARRLKRKITFYMGETCSGKTYLAHNILSKANNGLYLAPLRLLALEGQEEQKKRGVVCSYLTGEEQDFIEGATHLSSTIEMINLNEEIDVAVIDEIQLLGDAQRGWAWSQALLGAPAKHIILTGSPNALKLVEKITKLLDEPLKVIKLNRLTKLQVERKPVSFHELQRKDCIVAFSRREVLQIKYDIEKRGYKVSVIYGGLPPEVRREESRRFNSEETDILVATDAIAMGLNLPIRRVIFYTTAKMINRQVVPLTSSEIRQIGGLAGRYGREDIGYVSAFNSKDLENIQKSFSTSLPEVERANIIPTLEHIKIISSLTGEQNIGKIFRHFKKYVVIDSDIFCLADMDELLYKTEFLERIKNLDKAFDLAVAPVDIKDKLGMEYYKNYVAMLNEDLVVPAPKISELGNKNFADVENMKELESFIKVCNLYNWLHFRYPENFKELPTCASEKRKAVDLVIEILSSQALMKKCGICGKALPLDFPFSICNSCFNRRYNKKRNRKYYK